MLMCGRSVFCLIPIWAVDIQCFIYDIYNFYILVLPHTSYYVIVDNLEYCLFG